MEEWKYRKFLNLLLLDIHIKLFLTLVSCFWVAVYYNLLADVISSPFKLIDILLFISAPFYAVAAVCLFMQNPRDKPCILGALACFVQAFHLVLRGGAPGVAWQNFGSMFLFFGLPLSYHLVMTFPARITLFKLRGIGKRLIVAHYIPAAIFGIYKFFYGICLILQVQSDIGKFILGKQLRNVMGYSIGNLYQGYILIAIIFAAAIWLSRMRKHPEGTKFYRIASLLAWAGIIGSLYFVIAHLILRLNYSLVMMPLTFIPISIIRTTYKYHKELPTDEFFFNSFLFSIVLALTGVVNFMVLKGTGWLIAALIGKGKITDIVPIAITAIVLGPSFLSIQDYFKKRTPEFGV